MKSCRVLIALLIVSLTTAGVRAEDVSWMSLPGQTLLAMRLQDGAGFVEKLQTRTKFGSVMLHKDRWAGLVDQWKNDEPGEWQQFVDELAEVNLKPSDFIDLFAGDSGMGLTYQMRDGKPFFVILAWFNPGEDVAARLYKAIGQIPEQSADDAVPVKRVDLEIAGEAVMHLAFPHMQLNAVTVEVAEDGEAEAEVEPAEPRLGDVSHLLVHRKGGRVVMAVTPTQSGEQIVAEKPEMGDALDQATGIDQAMASFATFLAAHDGGNGQFVQETMAKPGMDSMAAPGDGVAAFILDIPGLMDLATQSEDGAMVAPFLQAYGLHGMGRLGLSWSLDGNLMRGATFLEAKAPRPGLVGLFDQQPLQPQIPAWVPGETVNYSQFSLDLGMVYTTIKQITIETFGPMAQQQFAQVEQGSLQMFQVTPDKVLSSLGHRHAIVQYTPVAEQINAGAGEQVTMPMDRTAIVWQIGDEALWQRVMGAMGMAAQGAQGKMQFAEEQGFSGWRVEHEMIHAGLFLGKGHLVLGFGRDIFPPLFSAISNPDEGGRFAGSDAARRAVEVGDLQPGIMHQVSNTDLYMRRMLPLMVDMFAQMAAQNADDPNTAAAMAQFREALPTDAEMAGMFGVGGGQVRVNPDGVYGDSFLELPAAE